MLVSYPKKYKKTDAGIYSRQNYHMTSRYGITFKEYELMLKKQNGRCKICKTTRTHNKSHKRLSIDHCHKTNKIRVCLFTLLFDLASSCICINMCLELTHKSKYIEEKL